MIVLDLVGQRFDRLVVLRKAGIIVSGKNRRKAWLCRCDCGKRVVLSSMVLRTGNTRSCGCLAREILDRGRSLIDNIRHGQARRKTRTRVYRIWSMMKDRCVNPNNRRYKHYGGRGIKVCKRWFNFKNFYVDMGDPPKGRSLDRKNNDKGYYKRNCRWATRAEQAASQRYNRGPNRKSA